MVRVWVDGWAGGRGLTCPPTFAQPPPTHAHPPTHPPIVQLGGMVLHGGQVAEMRTGEGKTLVATLPAYLNALEGGSPPPLAAALSLPSRPPCMLACAPPPPSWAGGRVHARALAHLLTPPSCPHPPQLTGQGAHVVTVNDYLAQRDAEWCALTLALHASMARARS